MTAAPTHTPQWTARQREVLDLLARGCTNPQIAERLGISLDGAKWHVSEVITRLGVDTREEAADYWRAENGLRRRLFRMARMALPGAAWARVAFAALAVAAIGAGAVLAVLALRGSDNPAHADVTPPATLAVSPSATAPVSPTASPSATPDVIDGVTARPLKLGEPVELPSGILLSYSVAGYATDGPGVGGAHLVFRARSGQLIDTPPPRPPAELGTLYSALGDVLSPVIYAAVCTEGTCISLTYPSDDAQDRVYRSTDGGSTWLPDGRLPRGAYFTAFTSDGRPVISSRPGGDGTPLQFSVYPSGPVLQSPVPHAYFTQLSDGTPAWIDTDSEDWYSGDGTGLLWKNHGAAALNGTTLIASGPDSLFVTWQGTVGRSYAESPYNNYLGVADGAGKLTELLSWPGNVDIRGNVAAGPHLLLGNVSLDAAGRLTSDSPPARFEPALFDLKTATIHPIPELSSGLAGFGDGKNEHAFVSSVILGNFAQVDTGNDCLNLRESPSTTARSLACLHDGVLLRLRDEPSQTVDGAEWLSVDGPGAQHGWVAAEFVDR